MNSQLLYVVFLLGSFCGFLSAKDEQSDNAGSRPPVSQTFAFASYYESNMVLQRYPLRAVIWGYASSADVGSVVYLNITNAFLLRQYQTSVEQGPLPNVAVWKSTLDPVTNVRPFTVIASLKSYDRIVLQNVLFGDVWFCSGQSNMKLEISQIFNGSNEAKSAERFNQIRFFSVGQVQSQTPLGDLSNIEIHWSVPNQTNTLPFSAVCWLFAKYVYQQRSVPLGLVESSWGGTQIEAWSSPDSLQSCGLQSERHRSGKLSKKSPRLLENVVEKSYSNSKDLAHSSLWNAMVHPMLNMTIFGVLWYQGEANANYDMNCYNCTLPELVRDWRRKWNVGTVGQTNLSFPFGIVQLGPTFGPQATVGFPDIRWHQTVDVGYLPNVLMPNTFMAVAYDLTDTGGGVHFRDKQTVAHRLALSGMAIAYGNTDQKYIGPMISKMTLDELNHLLVLEYDGGRQPIVVLGKTGFEICCQRNLSTLCSLSGTDDWQQTSIISSTNTTVTLSATACDGVYLMGIRFMWRETPCPYLRATVYSVENNLPAPPYIARHNPGSSFYATRNSPGKLLWHKMENGTEKHLLSMRSV